MRFVIIGILCWTSVATAQPDEDAGFGGPPSKTLERAIKLYDKKDFFSASIELQKVLDGESGDDDRNKQRAEFFMLKTMYQMGFYAASLERLDQLVQKGAQHTYFLPAAKWNAALSRVLPGFVARGPLFAYRGNNQLLTDPVLASVHDELALEFGKELASRDVPKQEALAVLGSIPQTSEFAAKAQLEIARIKFRGKDIDGGISAAMSAAARGADYVPEAARLIASWTHNQDAADRARAPLSELAKNDNYARYQLSRSMLDNRDEVRGLGKISSEALDAVVFASACHGAPPDDIKPLARETIKQARATIDKLLAVDDNAELYAWIVKLRKSAVAPGDMALAIALSDPAMKERFTWIDELQNELGLIQKSDKAWQTTQVAAQDLQTLTVLQSVHEAETGKAARQRLDLMKRELEQLAGVLDNANPGFAISAGPKVEMGKGFKIAGPLCGQSTSAALPIAASAQPQARGCGGCSSSDPTFAVVLLLVLRRRRATSR